MPRCFMKRESNIYAQPNATHVKYTSAQPFTPKFVKDHLTRDTKSTNTATTTKKSPSYRAQALYDERVHRRQLGLTRRIQSQRTKAEKEKKKGVVKREKMGRREAAEMGVWRLRKEEARCVARAFGRMEFFYLFSYWFFGLFFQVGCVCPVASVMAWVYVRVTWIDGCGHAGAGPAGAGARTGADCSCDEGCYAFGCWDARQARQGRFSWLDHDRSVCFSPFLQSAFFR